MKDITWSHTCTGKDAIGITKMKQYITIEDLISISQEARHRLADWVKAKGFNNKDHQLTLSIGQLIEFLDEKQDYQFHIFRRTIDWKVVVGESQYGKQIPGELCDFLWEAVKDILEDKE